MKRFITRNWLMQLWQLAKDVRNPQGRQSGRAVWNSEAWANLNIHRWMFVFFRKASVLILRPFH